MSWKESSQEDDMTVTYDTYADGRLIGPKKTIRQIRQLFGDVVADMLKVSGSTTYGKYQFVKNGGYKGGRN